MADEYISREAVMQKFADHVRRSNNSDFAPAPTWNQAVQIVKDIPAADVAPRCPHYIRNIHDRGDDSLCEKWGCEVKEVQPVRHGRRNEESPDCLDGDSVYVCSVCGETWTLIEGTPLDNNMHYCPNCGARMDKEET